MSYQEINYTKEAFLNPLNLGFLIAAMLTAFFLSDAGGTVFDVALIMSFAAELIYLGAMPRNKRFRRSVRARRAAEHAKPPSTKEMFRLLTKSSQRRYVRLRKLEKEISAHYRKLSYATQGLLESHLRKIDGLLNSYLNMLYQKQRYELSTHSSREREVVQSIAHLRTDMLDDSEKVRAIKQRRLRVLEQRLQRFKKGVEQLEVLDAQIETIEDVVKYIHEQSLTLRNPEEITFQLDTLLQEVGETEAAISEIEDIFAPTANLLDDMASFQPEEDAGDALHSSVSRTRT